MLPIVELGAVEVVLVALVVLVAGQLGAVELNGVAWVALAVPSSSALSR